MTGTVSYEFQSIMKFRSALAQPLPRPARQKCPQRSVPENHPVVLYSLRVIPLDSIDGTSHTVMRSTRMQRLPPRFPGSCVILFIVNAMLLLRKN